MARDLDIGMPRVETQNVNVVVSAVIDNVTTAVQVNAEDVVKQLKSNRRVTEFILDAEVPEDD